VVVSVSLPVTVTVLPQSTKVTGFIIRVVGCNVAAITEAHPAIVTLPLTESKAISFGPTPTVGLLTIVLFDLRLLRRYLRTR
jgi:hypothetical protein